MVELRHIKPLTAAYLRLLQTRVIAEPSPACTMVVLNSSTSAVLKGWMHSLNARDVSIANSPWPPEANLAVPEATALG